MSLSSATSTCAPRQLRSRRLGRRGFARRDAAGEERLHRFEQQRRVDRLDQKALDAGALGRVEQFGAAERADHDDDRRLGVARVGANAPARPRRRFDRASSNPSARCRTAPRRTSLRESRPARPFPNSASVTPSDHVRSRPESASRAIGSSSTTSTRRFCRAFDLARRGAPFRPVHDDAEREGAAAAGRALDADRAAHLVRERLADRETQPGAAEAARDRRVDLGKRLEQMRLLVFGHADPGVAHRSDEFARRACFDA